MFETLTSLGLFLFIVLLMWSTIWKGFALWRAVKNNHLVWFIVLLIVNTAGILEIIYLLFFGKKVKKKAVKKRKKR